MSFEPGSAIKLKKHFGLDNALAFDISNACAGMFTAIKIVEAYLASGHAQTAMVVSGEYITHLTKTAQKEIEGFKDDRLACLTLGDAGAALILENSVNSGVGFHEIDLYTLGHYSDLCVGKATDWEHGGAIMYSKPSKLASVAIKHSVLHSAATCARNLWSRDAADHIIMHQTSESSINAAKQAMNLLADKKIESNTINNLAERGNTASTTHFVALWDAIHDGRIKSNDRIMFAISASGQTVGTALYTLDDLPKRLRVARSNGNKPAGRHANGRHANRRRVALPRNTDTGVHIESFGVLPADHDPAEKNTVAMAVAAAKQCLERSRYHRNEIDLIIFTGIYRSDFLSEPAIAAIIAGELGINADVNPLAAQKTFGFDIINSSVGCLNACDIACQAIAAKKYKRVMVVGSEIECNVEVRPQELRGVQETASAIILAESPSANKGFGRITFKYFTEYIDAFQCQSLLAGGKPYLKMQKDANLEELYLKCVVEAVNEFMQSQLPDAPRPTVILPPQLSSAFTSRLVRELAMTDQRVIDIATSDKEWFTSSIGFALEAAKAQGLMEDGDVGLILDVSPGIQVACAIYYF